MNSIFYFFSNFTPLGRNSHNSPNIPLTLLTNYLGRGQYYPKGNN